MRHNVAGFRLLIDGQDVAAAMTPRLIALSLTEKLEDGADELEITLANHDGRLAPIKRGVFASLALGWLSGPDVLPGLVDKGEYKVDQVEKSGPPDQLRITARSADFAGGFRRRRDKGWKATTLGEIVRAVAGDNGYAARVHPDLAGIHLPSAEQAAKSDMAFIRDLGRRYDAVATVKARTLLFLPIGCDTTAGGQAIPSLVLPRRDNSRFTFTIADREENDGAEAQWHDQDAARRRTVTEGGGSNPRRIKRHFASESEARDAAKAEAKRAARGQFTFAYELGLGDPAITPNRKVTLTGFDSEIDGVRWLVKQATHRLDGQAGLASSIEMDSLG